MGGRHRAATHDGLLDDPTVEAQSPLADQLACRRAQGLDYGLLLSVVGLLLIGLLMVYSASQFAVAGDPSYWVRRQLLWALLGCVALFVTARIDYHIWRRWAGLSMLVSLVLLALTLRLGETAYGAQRWLRLGISVQPSELAKLAFALYLADWLARKGADTPTLLYGLAPFVALTGLLLGLVLLQNDLGTSLILAALALATYFAAGASPWRLALTVGAGAALYVGVIAGTGFRRARVDAFLHPLPPGCGTANAYQVCQGLISLGSGGLFGRGLGDSVQKAGYLPNPFTDSIFAITGEELGLVGCLVIIGLFALLAFRGYVAARRAPDRYGALLACGIITWIVVQALVNVGSVVDAIPFTGVPLPFVSFGGSSLVTALAAVGVLLNIARQGQVSGARAHASHTTTASE